MIAEALHINTNTDQSIKTLIEKEGYTEIEKKLPFNLKLVFKFYYFLNYSTESIHSKLSYSKEQIEKQIEKAKDILLNNLPVQKRNSLADILKQKTVINNYFDKKLPEQEQIVEKVSEEKDVLQRIVNYHKADKTYLRPVVTRKPNPHKKNPIVDSLLDCEELKELEGIENHYISNMGRVFHYEQNLYFNYNKSYNKYYTHVWKDGKRLSLRIHRLVAKYFIENPKNLPDVLFRDGNNENCTVSNLYWGVQDPNIPTWNYDTKQKGETSQFCTKLNEEKALEIFCYPSNDYAQIAYEYNVSRAMVILIKQGKRWGWLTKQYETNSNIITW